MVSEPCAIFTGIGFGNGSSGWEPLHIISIIREKRGEGGETAILTATQGCAPIRVGIVMPYAEVVY